MKKTLIAAAALAALSASAFASSITVYGKIDQGLQVQHSKASYSGTTGLLADSSWYTGSLSNSSTTTFKGTSGISSGSRWGIKGTEDIADGYTVGFVLESGFDGMTGANVSSSSFFNRDCYLSVDTPFGQLIAGRTGLLSDGNTGDIIAGYASPFGTSYGIASSNAGAFSDLAGGRSNRAVRYVSPKFAGFQVHAEYANMNGGLTQSKKMRYGGIGISYANGPFYAATTAETIRLPAKFSSQGFSNPKIFSFAANYDFGFLKVFGGYQYAEHAPTSLSVTDDGTSDNVAETKLANTSKYGSLLLGRENAFFWGKYNAGTLGVSAPIGNGTLMASVAYRKGKNDYEKIHFGKTIDVEWVTAAIGYKYNFSKRTYLYGTVAYGQEEWEGKDGGRKATGKVTQFNLGLCHNF